MKGFTKVSLIICGILVAVGLLFVAIGAGFGFGTRQFVQMVRNRNWNWNWWSGRNTAESSEYDWVSDSEKWDANEVRNLDVEFDFGKLEFGYTDSDQLEVGVDYRNTWGSYHRNIIWNLDGDTLEIEDSVGNGILHLFSYGSGDAILYILIPKDKKFDEIKLDIGAAEVFINAQLNAGDMKFTLGAGNVKCNTDLSAALSAEKLILDIGAGEMNLNGIQADYMDVDCGTGAMSLWNVAARDMDVDCGVGSISIEMVGTAEDYDYKIDCGIGEVRVGDSSFSGLGQSRKIRNGTDRLVNIDCGVGEVEISFQK